MKVPGGSGYGKTKNDHFREMLVRAVSDKQLQAKTVLFDSWYASVENLKLLARLNLFFITTLKSNRLVSVWKDKESSEFHKVRCESALQRGYRQGTGTPAVHESAKSAYLHLQKIEWTPQTLEEGLLVKLKELPFAVRLFKIVAPNGDIEWLITNGSHTGQNEKPPRLTAHDVKKKNAVRWHIEQLHRELKQLVGSAKCQCRKARSQRNHLACCYLAWVAIKQRARQMQATCY
ncbi:MAG: transposase [Deinococcota bacterium]|nr:transposase [Deinococcota bacterium]